MKNRLMKNRFCKIALSGISAIILAIPWLVFRNQIKAMVSGGYVGLFLSCLLTNMAILIPAGSTMLVVIASSLLNPLLCILIGSIGAVIGEQSGYLCGIFNSRANASDKSSQSSKWECWMKHKSWLKVFAAAAIPLPFFDIVAINAGSIRMSWNQYTIATLCGKMMKYAMAVACFEFVLPYIAESMTDPFRTIIETVLNTFTIANAE